MHPAAPNQMRHWRHARRFPRSPALNMTVAWLLEGRPDVAALRSAAFDVVRRHESLIERPFEDAGALWFKRHDGDFADIACVEVSRYERTEDLLHALRLEAARSFCLETEPPTRVRLLELDDTRCVLVLNVHHIALDGWSVDVLVREISALYAAHQRASSAELVSAPSYEAYVQAQWDYVKSPAGEADRAYFRQELRAARTGFGFVPDLRRNGAPSWPRGHMTWAWLSRAVSDGIRAVAGALLVTPFVPLIGTFSRLCAKATGETDVLLGVPFANRLRGDQRDLVGFVVNTLPLRFGGFELASADFLAVVAQKVRAGFRHQRLPCVEILKDLGAEFASGEAPAFRTMFILQSSQSARIPIADLRTRQAWVSTGGAKYDQTWTIEERDGVYTLDVEWNPDLFSESSVHALMLEYACMLQALVAELAPAHASASASAVRFPKLDDLGEVFSGPVVIEARPKAAVTTGVRAGEQQP